MTTIALRRWSPLFHRKNRRSDCLHFSEINRVCFLTLSTKSGLNYPAFDISCSRLRALYCRYSNTAWFSSNKYVIHKVHGRYNFFESLAKSTNCSVSSLIHVKKAKHPARCLSSNLERSDLWTEAWKPVFVKRDLGVNAWPLERYM